MAPDLRDCFSFFKKFSLCSFTAQKMKFSIKDFFSKCDQIHNLVTFTEEALNRKLYFCAVLISS